MGKSIYLINPESDFPTYFGAGVYAGLGLQPATFVADLAIPTVAGMVPDGFDTVLCDENITPVDFEVAADFVGITGKVTQWGRMQAIAREFRSRGRVVVIGGPYASLSPDTVRPHCDILVRGELENIAGDLFADLQSGQWRDEYVGDVPDLSASPLPRWDLYPNDRAVLGTLQTSRGCPFECEFCDVIQYLGRKQRHKAVPQVLRELDVLYSLGYRTVILADDNFTVYRARTKELLAGIKGWNAKQTQGKMRFATQVSIDVARDDELLRMCAEAGVLGFFIGIETPNEESLKETKKRQNLKIDLKAEVDHIVDHGIGVTAGMIVGFDSDGPDIFERQYEFAMSTPIPLFSVGALVAPEATPLYDRMSAAGRLFEEGSEFAGSPWDTNVIPQRMSREALVEGLRWLCNRLYHPDAFGQRLMRFMDQVGSQNAFAPQEAAGQVLRTVEEDSLDMLVHFQSWGSQEVELWSKIKKKVNQKPELISLAISLMLQYMQVRYVYEQGQFWDAQTPVESK